jgi:hypothetical protein
MPVNIDLIEKIIFSKWFDFTWTKKYSILLAFSLELSWAYQVDGRNKCQNIFAVKTDLHAARKDDETDADYFTSSAWSSQLHDQMESGFIISL